MRSLKLLAVILAGFWVAACVTTSSTRTKTSPSGTPQQPQTESSQTRQAPEQPSSTQQSGQGTAQSKQKPSSEQSPASQSAPKEASRDTQKQTPESSEAGPAESQETDKYPQQQASETSQSGQTAAEQAAKDQQQQASEQSQSGQPAAGSTNMPNSGTVRQAPGGRPASAETADSKLAQARENLRISEATEKRIASELEQLKRSGTASPETIKNYETYHQSVKEMVAENRKIVEQMEAAKARHASGTASTEAAGGGSAGNMQDPRIPEEQSTDEVAALDRQLNASLNQFDAKLLKEMDDIREGSAEKMRDLAQEAAEAAKRLREKGVDEDTSGSESSEGSGEEAARDRDKTQTEQDAKGSKSDSTDASRPGGKGTGGAAQDRASAEDDDIVARQLREAAENETDPELKEKLWKEYDEYKKNQR